MHRDLKPANIIVGEEGSGNGASTRTLYVADFGLAR
jgi:serine/threonine protein kinase